MTSYPAFKKITIDDADFLRKYINNQHFNCDWAIANIICWQDFYHVEWCFLLDHIIIRLHVNGGNAIGYMLHPVADTPQLTLIIDLLTQDAAAYGQPLRLLSLSKDECNMINHCARDPFFFDNNRDYEDYIYLSENLKTLRGSQYAAKRNHVNQFSSHYSYSYQPLRPNQLDECLRLEKMWLTKHFAHETKMTAEQKAIQYAFQHFDELNLIGGSLYVGDQLIAFTYGSEINEQTFGVHIEKADTEYKGVYSVINHLFVNHLPEKYVYINREDDMGLEGLRKSKLSYYPYLMEPKYTALKSDAMMHAIINIWTQCFEDESDYVTTFLVRYYIPEIAILRKVNHIVAAMMFMIPCDSELGKVFYIFGVATLPDFRHQGVATSMLNEAILTCKEQNVTYLFLIPGHASLKTFYANFGFEDVNLPVEFMVDFDFGTGNPEKNKAMILRLKDSSIPLPDTLHCKLF